MNMKDFLILALFFLVLVVMYELTKGNVALYNKTNCAVNGFQADCMTPLK